ncbi:MAG: phosphoadenylyl-sulfate reductase [Deltaproteobacteria bacterium]|nr:phosphoadenylyl-sulfate reductase [Deltaproteobacteria bacterium]
MKISEITKDSLEKLNAMPADELIKWAFENFGERCAIGTSFQLTGTVMIDIASRHFKKIRVFTIDTLRLHHETYEAITAAEKRYGLTIERFAPDQGLLKGMIEKFGEYLFFMDKAKQEHCCFVRKVEPNRRALKTLDVWITGLRKDQSDHRKIILKADIIEEGGRKILKLAPLADWSMENIWRYIRENNLSYNKLFDMDYDSIGCIICSTPLVKGEPPRSGRWRWFNKQDDKKECGIHTNAGNSSNTEEII